jgi:hypothetical protein
MSDLERNVTPDSEIRTYPPLPWILSMRSMPERWKGVMPRVRTVFIFSILAAAVALFVSYSEGATRRWVVLAAAAFFLLPGLYQALVRLLEKTYAVVRISGSSARVEFPSAGEGADLSDVPVSSLQAVSESGTRCPPSTFFLVSDGKTLLECRLEDVRDPFLYEAAWNYFSQDSERRPPLAEIAVSSGSRNSVVRRRWAMFLGWGLILLILILWDMYEKMMDR